MRERNGNVIAQVIIDTKKTIEPIVFNNVLSGSNVFTDEWHAYNNINKVYFHGRVNHDAKQSVNSRAHTNGIENF